MYWRAASSRTDVRTDTMRDAKQVGLAAVAGILFGESISDMRVSLVGIGAGLVILFLAYRFFRHGSEIVQGEFKEKKSLLSGSGLKQLTDVAKTLEGFR